eukprot:m.237461 g.237461  ORF g.237461 m.237461 type:complete len:756 (-) comp13146_c0_seq1:126-2393(-)
MAAPRPEFLRGFPTFQDYSQSLISSLVMATKSSNALPKGEDYNFHRTEAAFRQQMKVLGIRVLTMVEDCLQRDPAHTQNTKDQSMDDSDRMGAISEVCASMYERVDQALDERAAATRSGGDVTPSVVLASTWPNQGTHKRVRFMHAKNIRRPQEDFPVPVDNTEAPFLPPITEKPHAISPLALEPHCNPYQAEIQALEVPAHQLKQREPQAAQPLDGPVTWVDTVTELQRVATVLDGVTEFAVDLEAHSFRSYQGFTCLMQISTRTEDFLVDTLALRAHMRLLASAFANPRILKVLHGADSDIIWLQRDFGLYIVNMFDTGQAMRVLDFPRFSLAYLLSTMCNVTANKAFQLADWRIRPLSAEMLHYAREDTHYLLYIHDRLVNQLVEKGNKYGNLINAVYQRSKELCQQAYEKPVYTAASADELVAKHIRPLSGNQLEVFYALHQWRDAVARDEDESIRYVLPDHMLFEISDILPREPAQVLACCQPTPPLVRIHIASIIDHINAAKLRPPRVPAAKIILPEAPRQPMFIDADNLADDNLDAKGMSAEQLFEAAAWVSQPPSTGVLFQSDDEDFDLAALQRTMRIRASISSGPLFGVARKEEQAHFERKGSNESTESAGPDAVAGEPTSFKEIYRLSNINRRKNKEKKKQRDDPAEEGPDSDEGEPEAPMRDAEAFMQAIGWVTPADSQAFAAAAPATAAPVPSFDYGAAPALPGGGHMEPKPTYSPHVDEHRGSAGRSPAHMKQGQRSMSMKK